MRYQLIDVELAGPVEGVAPRPGYAGLGVTLRMHGRPVGFLLIDSSEGTMLPADRLAEMADHALPETARRLGGASAVSRSSPPLSLTVAVCTRNRPDDLARCLAALEAARYPAGRDARILVVHNAPTDDSTRALVARHPGVDYVIEPRPGLDFARNTAVRCASTTFLAFVDDDAQVDTGWMSGLAHATVDHPYAAAFTGPILPAELETEAQILFERRGGYNRRFESVSYSRRHSDGWLFPFRGIAGSGCNMAFRREVLLALQGFDEALDTGRPLPGGGDLDMFHRVVQAGFELVNIPEMTVFHRHRRTFEEFCHQMYTWDLGFMAYVMKTARDDPKQRAKALAVVINWGVRKLGKLAVSLAKLDARSIRITLREIQGGVTGILGEYQRSLARVEAIRRAFGPPEQRAV